MRLSRFIADNMESILQEWEDFARTIDTPEADMDAKALRDHAALMLQTIVADLEQPQTSIEQSEKSKGLLHKRSSGDTYAEIHAECRLEAGFTVIQLVSEYRALRASVLKLWARAATKVMLTDRDDMTRFNEAIDLALAESVARYSKIVGDAAERSQARLEAILQAAPVGIAMANADGTVTLANEQHTRIWGDWSPPGSIEEYEGWKGWWADGSAKHGEPLSAQEWPMARVLQGAQSFQGIIEIEPFGLPGVRHTILSRAAPFHDSQGKVMGGVVAQMDITSQIRAEAALSVSEAKFRTIANAMPQMVWSTLPDGFHDYFNQQWYEFTGAPEGSTDGEGWNGLFHPGDQARAWEIWRASLATGENYEIQYRLRHRSGTYRWVLGRALPVRNDAGDIIRWMGTCTDIHDQKVAEQRLQNDSERKDEFLAMLAHELRNPLAPISSAAQILNLVSNDPKGVEQAGAVIGRQVNHMSNLVDDLLDVSRVTRGLVSLTREAVDLKMIVASAVEQIRPLLDARKQELIVQLDPGPVAVSGDRTRLVQVIANVLNNAAKYSPVHGKIVIAMQVFDSMVSLAVIDNGAGIDATLLPQIFDLFTQGERTPDRVQGGLGLGLALVKSLVTLHDGTVTATSSGPGEGSTVTITLPLLAERGLQANSAATPAAEPQHQCGLRIMVVDDNVDAAQALSMLLELNGHQVVVHEDAFAALEDPDRCETDVFILDIGLPGMDGYELTRRLRQDPATATAVILALTGYGQAQDLELARAAGFNHHFVKPVKLHELNNVLAKAHTKLAPSNTIKSPSLRARL